jgi:putative sterol carrier protein
VLSFDRGAVTVAPKDGQRADCVINADPASFLLVGYGRASQWGPIMRGKLLAAGRKPWRALRFNSLLVNP